MIKASYFDKGLKSRGSDNSCLASSSLLHQQTARPEEHPSASHSEDSADGVVTVWFWSYDEKQT